MSLTKYFALSLLLLSMALSQTLSPTIDKTKYPNSITLESGVMTLYYLMDDEKQEIEVAIETTYPGYLAWGLSRSGKMVDSDIYLGWISGGVVTMNDYSIGSARSGNCPNGVCLDTTKGGTDSILEFNGSESPEGSQLIMRRKYDTGDSLDVTIDPTSDFTVIYAYHTSVDGIAQHSVTPTPVVVNFFTGGVKKVTDLKLIHGSMMFIAWFCISPFGFFLARFMKGFSWWFQVHRAIMFVAMLLQVAAFGVIVADTASHFDNTHKVLGLIVVIIGVAQPVIGFLADKFFNPDRKATPIFPDKTHWVLGWVSITAGLINIILGLILYPKTADGVLIAYCVIAAIVFIFCVGLSIYKIVRPSENISAH